MKIKNYFIVRVEGIAPVFLEYRVLAEDPEGALEEYKKGRVTLESAPKVVQTKVQRHNVSVKDLKTGLVKQFGKS
jgi:hypothetical protein